MNEYSGLEAPGVRLTLCPARSLGSRSLFLRTGNITSQIHQAVAMVICSEHFMACLRLSEAHLTETQKWSEEIMSVMRE